MLPAMPKSAEVDRWFEATKPAREEAMRCARDILLGADARIAESVNDGTVQFAFLGDLAAFANFERGEGLSLVFHRGAKLAGAFPHLEGNGPAERYMRFENLEEVRARANELRGIAVAWCKLMSSGGGEIPKSTRVPGKKTKKFAAAPKKKTAAPKKKR
ncbi:hypothetical protein BH09MYX1_BH09MYX1_06970 [soil metagenome]